MDAVREKAAKELKTYQKRADTKAKNQADKLSASTEDMKASLRARAEERIDNAAKIVVERIVSS